MATSTDPRLGAIRLAWWRERLEELKKNSTPPAEPRLLKVASELLPRGVDGVQLSQLEDGWLPLLEAFPWGGTQSEGLKCRGRVLFSVGAHLLGEDRSSAEPAGELWSLVDGARHCSDAASREMLLGEARSQLSRLPEAVPRRLRRLTVLAAVAAHDLLAGDRHAGERGWRRFSAALRHGTRGTFPRN